MGKEGGTARRGRGAGGRSPGCKLTPAPRGTRRTAARARTLAFTLASCSLAPSGDCNSPPRATTLHLKLIQILSIELHGYTGKSFSHPPAKPETLASTPSHPLTFFANNPQSSARVPTPLPPHWQAALPPAGKLRTRRSAEHSHSACGSRVQDPISPSTQPDFVTLRNKLSDLPFHFLWRSYSFLSPNYVFNHFLSVRNY